MEQVLGEFISSLRRSGVRISTSESMDAAQALALVGYGDRALMKESLGATLAKSLPEKIIFDDCFERFFSPGVFEREPAQRTLKAEPRSALARMLMTGEGVSLIQSVFSAARSQNLSGIRFQTQKGLFTLRILDEMGMNTLEGEIRDLSSSEDPDQRELGLALQEERSRLIETVRDVVDRHFELFASRMADELIENYLRHTTLTNLEERYFHQMNLIVQKMVKQLRDRYSRRRKAAKRGQLDFKLTLRKNIVYDGKIFVPKWKREKRDRPEIMAICDISRSVSRLVRFLLLFLYGLNEVVHRIRTFIFCSNLIEVTPYFDKLTVEQALARLQTGEDLPILMGRTDYDRSFRDFRANYMKDISRKTTVIILGDARNNYNDPRTEVLKTIYQSCRRLIWMNPESRSFWGTGDSEMNRYRPYCHIVRECHTVDHLERVVSSLLKVY